MPSLKKLWADNKDKGLHVFHIEVQGHSADQVRAFCEKNGMEFPNLAGKNGFGSYDGGRSIPYAFVIGVDGKVVFQGNGGYKGVIIKELEKVKYPGLGKSEVASPLHKAAVYIGAKQYAKSITEVEKARKKLDASDEDYAAATADADYIVARALELGQKVRAKIDAEKESRDYDRVLERLEFLSKAFKGHEIGDAAKAESKALRKDAAVKKELKAFGVLAQVTARAEKEYDPEKKRQHFEAFIQKFGDTRAADRARNKIG